MDELIESLSQRLHDSSRRRNYAAVKIITIYWENGGSGFKDEAHDVGRMFRQIFQYDVEDYAIPTQDSQLALKSYLGTSILDLKNKNQHTGDTSLFIIHYGGHGDSNDDRTNGKERRSVWAEQSSGPTVLKWYEIQENLAIPGIDILLLLDCCFAAQAGRDRREPLTKFELLAAAGVREKTPPPGADSFTKDLIDQITKEVSLKGYVRIVDLHHELLRIRVDHPGTPVYAALHANKQSIILHPVSMALAPTKISTGDQIYFQFEFCTTEPSQTDSFSDSVAQWLGENAPRGFSPLTIQQVFQNTNKVHKFVTQSFDCDIPLAQALEPSSVKEIESMWKKLSSLITRYNAQAKNEHETKSDAPTIAQRLCDFISTLENYNVTFSDVLERHILNSNRIDNQEALARVVEDPMSSELGIVNQLQLRQTVEYSSHETMPPMDRLTIHEDSKKALYEYRVYGSYVQGADLAGLEHRVAHLAKLLTQPKSSKFLSLRCCGWAKDEIRNRFVLKFDIPDCYQDEETAKNTLSLVILEQKGLNRPTLNERLRLSLMLAKAVQSWHSVGWLHQGISSRNIFFLTCNNEVRPDYSKPLLQGFQFSRPNDERSIGNAETDIATTIYWHPDRQSRSRKAHTKLHDLYSLGVVLLEIGLWQSAQYIVFGGKSSSVVLTVNEIRSRFKRRAKGG